MKGDHDQTVRGRDEGCAGDTAEGAKDEEGVLFGKEGDEEVEDAQTGEAVDEDPAGREQVDDATPEEKDGRERDLVGRLRQYGEFCERRIPTPRRGRSEETLTMIQLCCSNRIPRSSEMALVKMKKDE